MPRILLTGTYASRNKGDAALELTAKGPYFLIPDEELQQILKSDLVVDLSGDMLTQDYGPHVAYSHFLHRVDGTTLSHESPQPW